METINLGHIAISVLITACITLLGLLYRAWNARFERVEHMITGIVRYLISTHKDGDVGKAELVKLVNGGGN